MSLCIINEMLGKSDKGDRTILKIFYLDFHYHHVRVYPIMDCVGDGDVKATAI